MLVSAVVLTQVDSIYTAEETTINASIIGRYQRFLEMSQEDLEITEAKLANCKYLLDI